MDFHTYQHIERIGTVETRDIEDGKCYIFPKLDGTNSSIWLKENGTIGCGSRKRDLSLDKDNAGFMNWATQNEKFKNFLSVYPNLRLFGEWLKSHTFKDYMDDAWLDFYVFDVVDSEGKYLSYEEYKPLMEEFGITYIPPLGTVDNPTYEQLERFVEINDYLVNTEKSSYGEGIVVKRYDYVNQYGRVTWGKIVAQKFKESHGKNKEGKIRIQEGFLLEESIAKECVDSALVEKEFSKIENDTDGWSAKYIPRLLNTIYYCVVTENLWNSVKKHKDPTINFKLLKTFVNSQIKVIKPELF